MEDRDILTLLFARNEQAIAALAAKFGHRLQRLAANILPTAQDAEEAVSDTYMAVWNTVPPNRPDPIAPYILRICKNISVSRLRSLTAQKRSAYEIALDELSETVGRNTLERIIGARILGQVIDRFLDTVPQVDRVIFLRRYWYGDRVKDIARRVSMTENAVSVHLNRLRSSLRDILVKEGYYER
jgi:RNA polymerase sigma-70 factor (ECF subfamily)